MPTLRGLEVVHLAREPRLRAAPLAQPLPHAVDADPFDEPVRRGVVRHDDREHRQIPERKTLDIAHVSQHPAPVDPVPDRDPLVEIDKATCGVGVQGHDERQLDDRGRGK